MHNHLTTTPSVMAIAECLQPDEAVDERVQCRNGFQLHTIRTSPTQHHLTFENINS